MTQDDILLIARRANEAAPRLAGAPSALKNKILHTMADQLLANIPAILEQNGQDLTDAEANGYPVPMLDRLKLNEERIRGICRSLLDLEQLPDPIGRGERIVRPNGLSILCQKVPLGTVAMIYEARPNVTVDAASLCVKTGNAVLLRGGKEANRTNRILVDLLQNALQACGMPRELIGFIDASSRETAQILMNLRGYVDVLIPRGGKGLIQSCVQNAKVPVIETGAGNCHLYVDESADLDMALSVALNAKCQRPSVCNAIETLLVHQTVAAQFLPAFYEASRKWNLEMRGCPRTLAILPQIGAASEEDWETEYDDYILAVKVVSSLDEAIRHINRYNTQHSEAIITRSLEASNRFKKEVQAACVYVNASTRFTDGGEFGFGAEIGISTQKLHVRGPMGLDALTTQKYLIEGEGQIRS